MRKPELFSLILSCLFVASTSAALSAEELSLDSIQGKWTVSKTREGQAYTQTLQLSKDKLTFQILDGNSQVRMFARGTVKPEKAGVFNVIVLSNVEAGSSADDLKNVDETRSFIYSIREDRLYIAANFDKERSREKPVADEYVRAGSDGADDKKTAAEGDAAIIGNWKVQVSMDDRVRDYGFKIESVNGKLTGTLVSPRSGEYPCKLLEFKNGELLAEVEREVGGNPVTLVLKARVAANSFSGTIAAKGAEALYTGSIKATK